MKVFDRYWRIHKHRPDRYRHKCRVLARGAKNSCLIEFEDGERVITDRWNIRKLKDQETPDTDRH
jgi:hypothetical protein